MTTLQNKIDFAVIFSVRNANPNGDPLNGNRPRTDYSNYGEVSDVSIKRKLRDRLLERWIHAGRNDGDGNMIYVQADDRKADDAASLRDRLEEAFGKELSKIGKEKLATQACERWLDVRAFGSLFALKGDKSKKGKKKAVGGGDEDGDTGVSIGVRGPVTVQSAFSVEPIDVTSVQITKSVNGEGDGVKVSSDRMGTKHRVDRGIYVFKGSINPQLADRTGFSDADADAIKTALTRLFENDESSARPSGSMEVLKVIWWKHNSRAGQHSSARVHRSLGVNPDGSYRLDLLEGLVAEEIDGA